MKNNIDYATDIRKKLKTNDLIMVPSASVVPIKDSKILLQLRTDTNKWGLIGGGINYDETILETAARELKEETNLEAINYTLIGIYSQFNITYENKDKVNAFTLVFICELINENSSNYNDGETLDLKWFSIDQIRKLNLWNNKVLEICQDTFTFLENNKVFIK